MIYLGVNSTFFPEGVVLGFWYTTITPHPLFITLNLTPSILHYQSFTLCFTLSILHHPFFTLYPSTFSLKVEVGVWHWRDPTCFHIFLSLNVCSDQKIIINICWYSTQFALPHSDSWSTPLICCTPEKLNEIFNTYWLHMVYKWLSL